MGIVLVVLGHNIALADTEAQRILFSFRMPLFLFMSGLFLKPGLALYLRSRSQALLKPYLVVAVASAGLLWLKSVLLADHELPMLARIAASKLAGVAYAVGTSLDNIPLWFLPALFVGQLTALVLIGTGALRRTVPAVLSLLGAILLGLWVMTLFATPFDVDLGPIQLRGLVGLPWSVDLAIVAGAFVAAGHVCRPHVMGFRPTPAPLLGCGAVFAALHLGYPHSNLDLNTRLAVPIPAVAALAITGIYLALVVAWLLARMRLPAAALSACGRASLFILMFHSLPQQEVYRLLHPDLGWGAAGAISFVIGLVLPLTLMVVTHRVGLFSRLLLPPRPVLRSG